MQWNIIQPKEESLIQHGLAYNMDEYERCYTKWNKPITKGQTMKYLNMVKFIETVSRMLVSRSWRNGNGELFFNGYSFSFANENVLKMESGDVCTVHMYLMSLNYKLKSGLEGKLYIIYILLQFLK